MNTVLSAVQTSIGDLTDGVGANDLPVANIIAHTIAGGLAAEALGESFASGASAAFASAVAANSGLFDDLFVGDTAEDRAQKIGTIAQLIGGTASFLASSGRDAGAVNQGASIAQSATLNNYLTHAELRKYEEELEKCERSSSCVSDLRILYNQKSKENTASLEACGADNSCISYHINRIAQAAVLAKELNVFRTDRRGGLISSGDAFYVYQERDLREAIATYRTNIDLAKVCPGFDNGCVFRERAQIFAKNTAEVVADFTPVIGDVKGFYDAYKSGSKVEWAAAILGITPGIGDALGKLVKNGELDSLSRSDFDLLDEVQELSDLQKQQAYHEYVVDRSNANLRKFKVDNYLTNDDLNRLTKIRDDLNINSNRQLRRNVAFGEGHIDGVDLGEIIGVNGAKAPGIEMPDIRIFKTSVDGHPRNLDSEVFVLENVARGLTSSSSGTLKIISERSVCTSCQGVIKQFKEKFPHINLIVRAGSEIK